MFTRMVCFACMLGIFALNATAAQPLRVLHVSPAGSDSNDGLSPDTPFRSISQAAKVVQAGDLVLVRGGIYREQVAIEASGTAENPIIFRAAPDETALLTWGWDVHEWRKEEGNRFIYEAAFPYPVNILFERATLDRYLELLSPALLDVLPGSFFYDREKATLRLHTRDGGNPADAGIVVVPYNLDGQPATLDADSSKLKRWSNGIRLSGDHLSFEGFEIAFHAAGGRIMRVGTNATFCAFRRNTVYGTTNGLKASWRLTDAVLEDNRVFRVVGAGLQVGSHFQRVLVRNNTLIDNGPCQPFTGQSSATEGHPFNMNRYGGGDDATNLQFLNNLVISTDNARRYGVMRCKGGVANLEMRGNILVGGSPNIYAAPEKPGHLIGNTIVGGSLYIGTSASGKEYNPEIADNLSLKSDEIAAARFANIAKHDYRLLPDSPHLGSGALPEATKILFVNPQAAAGGDGTLPEKAFTTLAAALQGTLPDTIYLAAGTYQERINLNCATELHLTSAGDGEVVLNGGEINLSGTGKIKFSDLVWRDSQLSAQNGNCRFENCVFSAGSLTATGTRLELLNNTFLDNCKISATPERAVLRNNLFIMSQPALAVKAGSICSENNCFSGTAATAALQSWQQSVTEAWPSFQAAVELSPDYRLPDKSRLRFAGLGNTSIGARGPLPPTADLTVENLEMAMVLSDRALIRWSTPYEYADVDIICLESDSKKKVHQQHLRQGIFAVTQNSYCLRGLQPESKYQLELVFRDRNRTAVQRTKLSFTTPAQEQPQPRTLFVAAATGQDSQDGLSPQTAKKTISAALLAARRGDTVQIAAGIYPEMLEVYVDGLTLKGEQPGLVRLSAQRIFDSQLRLNQVSDITIDGLMFTDVYYTSNCTSLSLTDVSNITVQNCFFDRNRTPGRGACANVQLRGVGVNGLTVRNCIFHSGFHGIWVSAGDNLKYYNNTFHGIGINAIHSGCGPEAKVEMYNNIYSNVVSNHHSPAISTGTHGPNIYSDYNLYWHTAEVCPRQKIYGFGGGGERWSAPWQVMQKDMSADLEETRSRYGIEAHGLFADPQFTDQRGSDFSLKPESPTRGSGRDGQNIGADASRFSGIVQEKK
jgi:hypothetical protein